MLDVITRRGDLDLELQIGAEILVSEDPRNRGDHPDFFKASGIILSNFGKNYFFPLEKVKILRIFSQNWSSEGLRRGLRTPPDPPHKGKNFSLHFWTNWTILHTFKKMQKIDFAHAEPNAEFSAFFFFFLLCIVP